MNYKFKVNIDSSEFDEFVKNFPNTNFMQYSSWAKIKSNWKSELVGLYKDNKLVAVSLILKRILPLNYKLYYCPRGFVIDYLDKDLLKKFTDYIYNLAKKDKAIAIKIDPFICFDETYLHKENKLKLFSKDTKEIDKNLKEMGFVHNGFKKEIKAYIQPRYTMVVPLIDEEEKFLTCEDLRASYPKNLRNYIGEYHDKRGVEFYSSRDPKDLKTFVEVLSHTEKRQSITLRNENYFKTMMTNYPDSTILFFGKIHFDKYLSFLEGELSNKNANQEFVNNQITEVKKLIKTYGNSRVVAASIVMLPLNKKGLKVASFLYAGTNTEILPNLKVTNGLMFYRLCYAIKEKIHYADLGGVSGYLNEHLSIFKSKFNPLVFELVGEYDLVINKKIYYIFNKLLPIVKKTILKVKAIFRKK
jgi:serine/alanine adding enzyme